MNDGVGIAIRQALCACFGLAPDSSEALALFREAYTEPENTPRPARTADVIYWSLAPDTGQDSPAYGETDAGEGSHRPAVTRVLAYRLTVVCYGPAAEAYAQRIWALLYVDGRNFPREILRRAGIFPVPDPPPVEKLYEPEGSLWRRRADLIVSLRVVDTVYAAQTRPAIRTVPEVIIRR